MSVTLIKARRILRLHGGIALLKRGLNEVKGAASAFLVLPRHTTFDKPDTLLQFAKTTCGGIFSPFQVRWEICSLLSLVRDLRPKTVMEIGTANGGTLLLWTRVVPDDTHLISLDLPEGDFGDGYARWRAPIYRSFAVGSQRIDLVRADSHAPSSLIEIQQLLNGKLIDFLFIDGDHSYEGAKKDFEMYSPLVSPEGVIAFHDIVHCPPGSRCDVDRLWAELKLQYDSGEFIKDANQDWAGIGYLKHKLSPAAAPT